MVSSAGRAGRVEAVGGAAVDRKDPKWAAAFTPVPDDPSQWAAWEEAGVDFVEAAKVAAGGELNYAVSHAGETAFPPPFQTRYRLQLFWAQRHSATARRLFPWDCLVQST